MRFTYLGVRYWWTWSRNRATTASGSRFNTTKNWLTGSAASESSSTKYSCCFCCWGTRVEREWHPWSRWLNGWECQWCDSGYGFCSKTTTCFCNIRSNAVTFRLHIFLRRWRVRAINPTVLWTKHFIWNWTVRLEIAIYINILSKIDRRKTCVWIGFWLWTNIMRSL